MKKTDLETLLSPRFMADRVLETHRLVRRRIRASPENAFRPYRTSRRGKPLTTIDVLAEQYFMGALESRFDASNVRPIGEESLDDNPDLTNEKRICVLTDMIDGTDLVQRGFSNWCSAITVFDPVQVKILGAFVAVPSRRGDWLYYATHKDPHAYKIQMTSTLRKAEQLAGPNVSRTLRDATICLYAQKSSRLLRLLELSRKEGFMHWLEENETLDKEMRKSIDNEGEIRFRFYNLAGNPMMVRLAEGTVDVVFDLGGQSPHDVVTGAYIALKSNGNGKGAVISKPDGTQLTLDDLARSLLTPAGSLLTYVLAANETMRTEIVELLR